MKLIAKFGCQAILLLAFASLPFIANAQQRELLPDFEVLTVDNTAIRSQQLARDGKWTLLYVQPRCSPCEEIFRLFKGDKSQPDLPQNLAIMVGGANAKETRELAARFPWINENAWHPDPSRQTVVAMQLPGYPMFLGLKGEAIEWRFAGGSSDVSPLKSLLATWRDE